MFTMFLYFYLSVIMETERGTGRLETPGCRHHRWVALSLGELTPKSFLLPVCY